MYGHRIDWTNKTQYTLAFTYIFSGDAFQPSHILFKYLTNISLVFTYIFSADAFQPSHILFKYLTNIFIVSLD